MTENKHLSQAGNETGDFQLYAVHKKIYPARVKGFFRNLKWLSMAVLLGIYYLLPWVRFDRGPNAPDQAVLVDTINRKFYFFSIEIWPQEVILFVGMLVCGALALFFATSLAGRIWCGYACPQTVWTDLFVMVERWVEGDRAKRLKLDNAKWTIKKALKKITKHSLWILISLATGGAWVFYFVDAPTLVNDILHLQAGFTATFWMLFLTGTTYLLAGFAREQVCTYMCPYARFQGAMFDTHSLIVAYDAQRGETRGKHKKGESWDNRGDCVDCMRCVAVCPVGIDIRDGQQYQCINCGLCVDACNEIMDKVERPRGLIKYDTFHNTAARMAGVEEKIDFFRSRTLIYGSLLLIFSSIMVYFLAIGRQLVEMNVIHQRNPLAVKLSSGHLRNTYTVRIVNKATKEVSFKLNFEGIEKAHIIVMHAAERKSLDEPIIVPASKVRSYKVFVDAPRGSYKNKNDVRFTLIGDNAQSDIYDSVFLAP